MNIPVIHHDRLQHFFYGDLAAAVGLVVGLVLRYFWPQVPPALCGMASCTAFALGREWWNKRNGGRWSWADVGWTMGGGGLLCGAFAAGGAA